MILIKKIRDKLILFSIVLVILPLIIVSIFSYMKASNLINSKIEMASNQVIEHSISSFRNLLNNMETLTRIIAYSSEIANYRTARDYQDRIVFLFDSVISAESRINNIVFLPFDPNKEVVSYRPGPITGADLREQEWVKKAIIGETKNVWLKPRQSEFNGELILSCAKLVVHRRTGKSLGVLRLDLEVYQLSEIGFDIAIGNNGYLTIINEEGTILAHPQFEKLGQKLHDAAFLKKLYTSREGTLHYVDGENNSADIYKFTTFFPTNWKFIGVMSVREINHDTIQLRNISILVALVCMLIGIILAYLFSIKISKPIEKLVFSTELIAEGNFKYRIEDLGDDELGVLGKKFNWMANSVEEKQKELLEKQRVLENQKQELLRFDKLKDEFLANTSHELRTPLNGIIGIAESLMEGVYGKIPRIAAANLFLIIISARRLANMVNDILDFSRLKNQDIILQRKPLSLYAMVEVVITISKHLVAGKNITFKNQVPLDLPSVYADENRLQQILQNLIGNAIKFTYNGEIAVTAEPNDKWVKIAVKDTGIGIARDKFMDVFKSFTQAYDPQKQMFGGTGLGLSITKKLVELHEGMIWVDSELGKGSSFIFTLPLCSEEAALGNYQLKQPPESEAIHQEFETFSQLPSFLEKQRSYHEIAAHNNNDLVEEILDKIKEKAEGFDHEKYAQILVVDDDIINLQVMKNQLSGNKNWQVTTVLNGIEALRTIESGKEYDLAIIDVMIPQINGYELCRRIRKQHSLVDLPILMLTAKNRPDDILAGFKAGANDYILKPFDKSEFLARANTLLTLKKSINQTVENARRLESERKQRELAECLREASSTLGVTLELEDVLQSLLNSLLKVVDYDFGYIILKENRNLKVKAVHSVNESYNFDELKKTDLLIEDNKLYSYLSQKQVPVIDLHQGVENFGQELPFESDAPSTLAVPFIFNEQIIGILVLESEKLNQYTEYEASLVFTLAGQAAIAIENARLFSEIKRLANVDELTGLYNRRYFFELAEREYRAARRYNRDISVLLFDFDHFKKFNDNYGHDVGDKVLKTIAKKCARILRRTDIIGRYGGEEFAIILAETNLENGKEVAKKLREEVSKIKIKVDGHGDLSATISVGVSGLDMETKSLNNLLKLADQALYEAKRRGRNRVVVWGGDQEAAQ